MAKASHGLDTRCVGQWFVASRVRGSCGSTHYDQMWSMSAQHTGWLTAHVLCHCKRAWIPLCMPWLHRHMMASMAVQPALPLQIHRHSCWHVGWWLPGNSWLEPDNQPLFAKLWHQRDCDSVNGIVARCVSICKASNSGGFVLTHGLSHTMLHCLQLHLRYNLSVDASTKCLPGLVLVAFWAAAARLPVFVLKKEGVGNHG